MFYHRALSSHWVCQLSCRQQNLQPSKRDHRHAIQQAKSQLACKNIMRWIKKDETAKAVTCMCLRGKWLVSKTLRCEQLTTHKGNSVTLSPIQFVWTAWLCAIIGLTTQRKRTLAKVGRKPHCGRNLKKMYQPKNMKLNRWCASRKRMWNSEAGTHDYDNEWRATPTFSLIKKCVILNENRWGHWKPTQSVWRFLVGSNVWLIYLSLIRKVNER
jgi:hypothetical protein